MRLPLISSSLWYDESFVWTVSRLPLARWWAALAGDVHPPLYYAVMWLLAHLTSAPWALRLPSVICGVAVVYLGVQVARALDAPIPAQVGAALLLAFIPQQIYYSDELRMYSLLAMLYLAGVWCVLRRKWGWWAVCLTTMLYTHHYGWIYAATLAVLALWTWRSDWRRILMAGAAALVAYLPLLPTTLRQIAGTGSYWAGLGPDSLPMVLVSWLSGYSFSKLGLSALLIVGALAVLMAATWRAVYRRHYAGLWLVYAPLVIGLALALWKSVWLTRGFIGAGAAAAVLIAVELTTTARARWVALATLSTLLACGIVFDEQRTTVFSRFATPEYVAYLRASLEPGDTVICLGSASWMELQPYTLPVPVALEDDGDNLARGGLSIQTKAALAPPVASVTGRAWYFSASLNGYEIAPPVGARLVMARRSPEKMFHSELYVKEQTYGYIDR